VEFQITENENVYDIIYESEDPYMMNIIDDLQKKLTNGEYLSFFTSSTTPINGKRNVSEIIRVNEFSTITDFKSSEESFVEYLKSNSYPVWYIPLSTDRNFEYKFIEYRIIDGKVLSAYMSFKPDNSYSFILDKELRNVYIDTYETLISNDIYVVSIAEWPKIFGIVSYSDDDTQVIAFKSRMVEIDIDSGELITINDLIKAYKKYNFETKMTRLSKVVLIFSIPCFLIGFFVLSYIRLRKSY